MEYTTNQAVLRSNFKPSEEWKYDIDNNNKGVIIHILRNQLYSNKIHAVLREYGTNAADIHLKCKVTRPFQVTLPTPLSLEVKIRDFGTGLAQKEVKETYILLGKSTKRKSKKENGCLGLGSKSGFAYSDTFQIISYHNGTKTSYLAYVDESREGRISLIREEPTTESGIEIIIPVEEKDQKVFQSAALEIYSKFDTPPLFVDASGKEDIEFNKRLANLVPKIPSEGVLCQQHYSKVIMGNVAYPIDLSDYNIPRHLQKLAFYIKAPLGAVDFTASRESLENTEKTVQFIETSINTFYQKFHSRIIEHIGKKKDWWQAKKYLLRLKNGKAKILKDQPLQNKLMESTYKWRDQILNLLLPTFDKLHGYRPNEVSGNFITWKGVHSSTPIKGKVFYLVVADDAKIKILNKLEAKPTAYVTRHINQIVLTTPGRIKAKYLTLVTASEEKELLQTFSPDNLHCIETPSIKRKTRIPTTQLLNYPVYPAGSRWKQRKPIEARTLSKGIFLECYRIAYSEKVEDYVRIYETVKNEHPNIPELFITEETLKLPGWSEAFKYLSDIIYKDVNPNHLFYFNQLTNGNTFRTDSTEFFLNRLKGDYIEEATQQIDALNKRVTAIRDKYGFYRYTKFFPQVSDKNDKLLLMQKYPMLCLIFQNYRTVDQATLQEYVSIMDQSRRNKLASNTAVVCCINNVEIA